MNEELHTEDDYFRRAYREWEQSPSPGLREKILRQVGSESKADKSRPSLYWKQITCMLILLLSSLGKETFFVRDSRGTQRDLTYEKSRRNDNLDSTTSKTNSNLSLKPRYSPLTPFFNNPNIVLTDESKIYHRYHYHHHLPAKTAIHPQKADNHFSQDTYSALVREQTTQFTQQSNNLAFLHQDNTLPLSYHNHRTMNDVNGADAIHLFSFDTISRTVTIDNDRDNHKKGIEVRVDSPVTKPAVSTKGQKYDWEISPFTSLDYTQYHLDDDDAFNGSLQANKQAIADKERHELSYSAGLLVKKAFSKKLALQTGLVYSDVTIGIQRQTLYATTDANQNTTYQLITSSGYANVKPLFGSSPAAGDSITSDQGLHHLHYLSLPVMINYPVTTTKRFSFFTSGGITTSVVLSTKIETAITNSTGKQAVVINNLIGLRPLYFSFVADAEWQYHIDRHMSLSFMPVVKFALTSATRNYVVKTFPYTISAGAGISYAF